MDTITDIKKLGMPNRLFFGLSIIFLVVVIFLTGCGQYVNVKYRDDMVDIGNPRFEALDTSKSSFINGAWYDSGNEYMIIKLDSTYYHYCELPETVWNTFKKADSFGSYYNSSIKNKYDCREGHIP